MNERLPDDIEDRILQMLDGTLRPEEVLRLDAKLRADPDARILYRQLATLHSALEEQGTSKTQIPRIPLIPVERLLAEQNLRMVRYSLLAAAAVLLLSALVLWMKMAPRAPETLAEFRVGPDTTFTLTHASAGETPKGLVLGEGSRLQLAHGTLEVKLDSGVRCVVEGPADLKLVSGNRVHLPTGTAWFEVPPPAVGFTVETSQLTAVDLGTEFGVLARANAGDQLHVIKGSVSVKAAGSEGEPLVLKEGEARESVAGSGLREIDIHPGKFITALPEGITFFDADVRPGIGNTVLDGAGSFGATSSEKTSIDGRWSVRTRAGVSGGSILETISEEQAEPRLRTRFGLPKPGRYAIYGYFWNNKEGEGLWNAAFQLGSDGTMKTYSRRNAANLVADPAQFTGPVPTDDGTGEVLFQAELGVWDTSTDGSVVTVYIGNPEVSLTYDQRTWYDGVGFKRLPDE